MTFDEAVSACQAIGWALSRNISSSDEFEHAVTFSAVQPDEEDGAVISHTSRTMLVDGGRWNAFNADRDEAGALLAVVSRVLSIQAERLRAMTDAVVSASSTGR